MAQWHPTWIEIDVKQFRNNIQTVRRFIGDRLYCLPIKADAYGHGLINIARIAKEEGVDYLAVAHANEGVLLRQNGIDIPILVLGAIHKEQVEDLLVHDLEVSVSSRLKAELIRDLCKKNQKRCKVHIEIDTGMHRTGMRPETAIRVYEELSIDPYFDVIGIYSHFASADAQGHEQMEVFQNTYQQISRISQKPLIWHMGNSTGILAFPKSHLDMVRPSLLTFGYGKLDGVAPCFSLKSKVSYFKIVEEGKGISYDHTFYTQKPSRIVTVPVGYGDGYRRDLSNRGQVLIRGKKYPIVGAVCMDQLMVDVDQDDIFIGDEVVLIGKQGGEEIKLEEVAKLCNTIPYEILCGLNNQRMPKVYL